MGFGSPLQSTAIRAGYMRCRAVGHPGRMKVSGDRHVGNDVAARGRSRLLASASMPGRAPGEMDLPVTVPLRAVHVRTS